MKNGVLLWQKDARPCLLYTSDYTPNEIDEWILKNFTIPYNMEVKYRWDQSELDLNKTLVPVKEDVVIPVMQIVKHVWIEPYEVLAGEDFIRLYSPKKYVLVGSPMYNSDGTIVVDVYKRQ